MNRPITPADLETAQRVLAAASLRDPHMPRPDNPAAAAVAAALAEDLAGIDPAAAVAAVSTHYRQTTDRIMPAHIWTIVRGSDASRHASNKTVTEALASTEAGPGDRLAADRDQRELTAAGPEDAARERAAFQARMRQISDGWAMPKPTGFVGARARHSPRREPTGPTPAGLTICHRCAGDMRAPAGWDPASTTAVALFCPRCTVAVAADRKAAG